MSIVLIGYRGSGKTTVGRLLADRLGRPFVDLDQLITTRAGSTIKDIFAAGGERAFRDLESAALAELLQSQINQIIALGGGAILRPQNRTLLRQTGHIVIYLRSDPHTLHQRIHADPGTAANRPALTHLGGTLQEITTLLNQREPLYRAASKHVLDVTPLTPRDAAAHIEALLASPA